MGIRKQGERVKGTTRVSFGDRKLMTRLWIADKTSRYEKRRTTRQLNKKEKESLEQCPLHRAQKGFQSFLKDVRAPAKEFEVPEDDDDRVALETMSHMVWFELVSRHAALQDDAHALDLFLRDFVRDSKKGGGGGQQNKSTTTTDREFVDAIFADMGNDGYDNEYDGTDHDDDDDEDGAENTKCRAPRETSATKDVERLVRSVQAIGAQDDSSMPLLTSRRNMRIMHQYRRLAKRAEHSADTLTATSAHVLVGHMYHSGATTTTASASKGADDFAFAVPDSDDAAGSNRTAGKRRRRASTNDGDDDGQDTEKPRFDDIDFDYCFDAGGMHSTDALWPLMDGSASSARLSFQPKHWSVVGDSVVDEIAQMRDRGGCGRQSDARSLSTHFSQSDGARKRRRRASSFSGSLRDTDNANDNSESESASAVLGFGFADEEQHRRHLRSEQRRNNVAFSHPYEMERQQSAWTTCQRCREPVHTCDMVVRESIGIEDVACFHPACLSAVVDARASRKRQETLHDRDTNAEVRSLTAINAPQAQKDRIRKQAYEASCETSLKYKREREQFLRNRETTDNGIGIGISVGSSDGGDKKKKTTIDDLMRAILKKPRQQQACPSEK